MRKPSNNATEELVLSFMQEDAIGRNNALFRFVDLLSNIEDGCAIAVDAEWGAGKTFFVKQAKMILDAKNPQSQMGVDLRQAVEKMLGKVKFDDNYSCREDMATVYYDAWENDTHEDPLLSLMYATMQSQQSRYAPERQRDLWEIICGAGEASRSGVGGFLSAVGGKDPLKQEKNEATLKAQAHHFFDELVGEHGNRLVFFIDELDRCRPDYAVRLLERIKHYFDDDRITFVFSINMSQLQGIVKGYYGSELNALRYLDKFFDLRVGLPEVDYTSILRGKKGHGENDLRDLSCAIVARKLRLSLREYERYILLIDIGTNKLWKKQDIYWSYYAQTFVAAFVLPVAVGLKMTDREAFEEFVTGVNGEALITLFGEEKPCYIAECLENVGEAYDGTIGCFVKGEERTPMKVRLLETYDMLFKDGAAESGRAIAIGSMRIDRRCRDWVSGALSLLSDYADFSV